MGFNQEQLLRLLLSQRAMLIGYILSIVHDLHLAEDIFQNVSLLVLKKGEILETVEDFSPWSRKIARFEALNMVRKRRNQPQLLDETMLDALEKQWSDSDLHENEAQSRMLDALRECIRRLTPRAQQLLKLRYTENLNGKQLSERIERPLNTVYVSLSRIHRSLGDCIRSKLELLKERLQHG